MRGLEEPISAFPGNAPMTTSKTTTSRSPVTRPLAFPAQCPIESAYRILPFAEELRRFDLASIAQREKNLQAEVHPGTLSCLVIEVRLIGEVQPLDHPLSSLGAHAVPVLKAALFLQLRQMALQLVVAWIRAIKAIVATRQGDEVIPDLGSVLNTFGQQALMLGSVQAVFEGASHLRPKGSALSDAPGRVAMGRERPPVRRTDNQNVVLRSLAC